MEKAPVRSPPVFADARSSTCPSPAPDGSPATPNHVVSVTIVHAQPEAVWTATGASPPLASNEISIGSMRNTHGGSVRFVTSAARLVGALGSGISAGGVKPGSPRKTPELRFVKYDR